MLTDLADRVHLAKNSTNLTIAAPLGELPQHPRTTTDAFTHAPTREAIVGTGRKTLLIAGEAIEVIVQHSALSAAA